MFEQIKNLPWESITFSEWIQMALGLMSTVVISFWIYFLQSQHEKEIERLQEKQRQDGLTNQADKFIIKFSGEKDYLPWCILAARLHRHENHTRPIYSEFCSCSDELQEAIIRRAGLNVEGLSAPVDVHKWIELLITDIEIYGFGRDVLYDNAKYFFRAFKRYRSEEWDSSIESRVFQSIRQDASLRKKLLGDEKLTFAEYIDEYFYSFSQAKNGTEIDKIPIPPIDYMWYSLGIANSDEKTVCMWVVDMVTGISAAIYHSNVHNLKPAPAIFDLTDAIPQNFEDYYYYAIQCLCFAYARLNP